MNQIGNRPAGKRVEALCTSTLLSAWQSHDLHGPFAKSEPWLSSIRDMLHFLIVHMHVIDCRREKHFGEFDNRNHPRNTIATCSEGS